MPYLDNNATTSVAPEVREAMLPFLTEKFGNPSSAHTVGRLVRKTIEDARASVAELLGAADPHEIVFTSGGTESDNWALMGGVNAHAGRRVVITSAVEHEAVRNACKHLETQGKVITIIGVDGQGRLDIDGLRSVLNGDVAIVSLMMANNETGVIFPVSEIARAIRERSDALIHVDGVAAAGKIPVELKNSQIDLFSISAHKFHGPKGIGALYIREGVSLPSITYGGNQEGGRRAGTEAVHQIAGIGAAAKVASDLDPMKKVRELRDRLENEIIRNIPVTRVNGDTNPEARIPNTTNISFSGLNGEMLLSRLDDAGISVSAGSACNSESKAISPVLRAMEVPFEAATASIRFSLGRTNIEDDIERVLEILPSIVNELRAIASDI